MVAAVNEGLRMAFGYTAEFALCVAGDPEHLILGIRNLEGGKRSAIAEMLRNAADAIEAGNGNETHAKPPEWN